MGTLLAEPLIEEANLTSPALPEAVPERVELKLKVAELKQEEGMHPLMVVFIACFIAFNLSAVMVGAVVAWIYQLRHSGAFAP